MANTNETFPKNSSVNRMRAHRLAQLIGHDCWPEDALTPMLPKYRDLRMPQSIHLEYSSELATFVFYWGDRQGNVHSHPLQSLATWFNVYEPGYISDEELNLLRVKVKLTTC